MSQVIAGCCCGGTEAPDCTCASCSANLPSSIAVSISASWSEVVGPDLQPNPQCAQNPVANSKCRSRNVGQLYSIVTASFETVLHRALDLGDWGAELGQGCSYYELASGSDIPDPCWDPSSGYPQGTLYQVQSLPLAGTVTQQLTYAFGNVGDCTDISGSTSRSFALTDCALHLSNGSSFVAGNPCGFDPTSVNASQSCACWYLVVNIAGFVQSVSQVESCSANDPSSFSLTGNQPIRFNRQPHPLYTFFASSGNVLTGTAINVSGNSFSVRRCAVSEGGTSAVLLRNSAPAGEITAGRWNHSSLRGMYREMQPGAGFHCQGTLKSGPSISAIIS